jgi:hypothetical protein
MVALRKALEELNRERGEGRISHSIHERLSEELEIRLRQVQEEITQLEQIPAIQSLWEKKTRKSLLMLEKSTIMDLSVQGLTMSPLIRFLGLGKRREDEEQY